MQLAVRFLAQPVGCSRQPYALPALRVLGVAYSVGQQVGRRLGPLGIHDDALAVPRVGTVQPLVVEDQTGSGIQQSGNHSRALTAEPVHGVAPERRDLFTL